MNRQLLVTTGIIIFLMSVTFASATVSVVNLESPGNNSWASNATPDFTFNVTSNNNNSMVCELLVNGVGHGVNASTLNATSTTIVANASLSQSLRSWVVNCSDANNSLLSNVFNLHVDTQNPVVISLNTPPNNTYAPNSMFNFNFTSNDNLDTNLDYTIFLNGVANETGTTTGNATSTAVMINLSEGTYVWTVQVADEAGNSANFSSFYTVTVDNTAPSAVTINSPSNDTWTTDNTPEITFTTTDNLDSVLNYTVYIDGSAQQYGAAVNNTATNVNLSTLGEGTHTVVVESRDDSGLRTNSTARTINIDTANPVVAALVSPGNDSLSSSANILFNFTSYDLVDSVLDYTLYLDSVANATGVTRGNATWTNVTVSVSDGAHSWIVEVTDEAGNSANYSSAYVFTVDATAPSSSTINSPANDTWTADNTPAVNFTLVDAVDSVLDYVVYVDGAADQSSTVSNGSSTVVNLNALTDGSHTIVVEAIDNAAWRTNSSEWTINVDTAIPVVSSMSTPLNNSFLNTTSVLFNFTSSDNLDGVLDYLLFLNGSANQTGLTTGNATWTNITVTLAEGSYYWTVQVTDEASNSANYSLLRTFDVDTTAPVTTDDTPAGWQDSAFTITLSTTETGAGVNYTTYSVNGVFSNGSSININTDGNHTITYYSVDNALNVESVNTVYALLDSTDPVVTLNAPINGASPSTTVVEFNFTSSDLLDTDGVLSYTLYIDGVANASGMTLGNDTWTNVSAGGFVAEQSYDWLVEVTDEAGNSVNSSTRSFTIAIVYPSTSPVLLQAGVVDSDTDGNVELSWAADGNADYYRVYRAASNITDASGLSHLAEVSGATSFEDNSTTNGTTYWYAVTTVFDGGIENKSVISDSFNVTSNDQVAPKVPSNVSASLGADGAVTLSWSAVTQDINEGADLSVSYKVFRTTNVSVLNTSNATPLTTTSGLTYKDTAMITGTVYSYVVTVVDDGANHNGSVLDQNNVSVTPTACTTTFSYSDWSTCSSSSQSRTGTRTCYGGGETTDSDSRWCSSGSSSSSSSTWTPPNPKVAKLFSEMDMQHPSVMKVVDKEIGVRNITINVKNPVKNVKISIEKLDGKPASVSKEVSGKVYRYLQINKENLADEDIDGNVTLTFEVDSQWLSDNSIGYNDVVLKRFTDRWVELHTRFVSSDGEYHYFDAQTPGFSYFVIGQKESVTASTPETTTPEQEVVNEPVVEDVDEVVDDSSNEVPAPTDADEVALEASNKNGSSLWWLLLGVVVVGGIVAAIVVFKRKQEPPKEYAPSYK